MHRPRLPRATVDTDYLTSSGIRGLSLAAGSLGPDQPAAAAALASLAGAARVRGMRSLLVEVAAPGLYRAALAAGVDHIVGDGLMPPLRRPGRAFVVGQGRAARPS